MMKSASFGGVRRCVFAIVCILTAAGSAAAQENSTAPAPPLEFPFEATPEAPRGVAIQFLRAAIEKGADFGLCKALMTKDGKPMPRDAQNAEFCPNDYAQKVAANQGFIQWAGGARPLQCNGCVGRPFMSPETKTTEPNLRRAKLLGRLQFLSTTGPNRTITYPFDAYFTCKAANGAREGNLIVDIRFGPPVIGEPGFWENLASFFTAGALSDFIDSKIKENVQNLPSIGSAQGRCLSVGVGLGSDPRFDVVHYDLPASGAGASAGAGAAAGPAAVGALRESVTIRLLSVKRLPLPPFIAPEHGRPGDPAAGQFSLYVNGVRSVVPPAGLALPPEGGSAPLNFCKTADPSGRQALQILFTNDLGGAVWSQFDRSAQFGVGGVRKMTTGRSIIVPAPPGPPDPVTGKPSVGGKPGPVILREFELTYDIAFSQPPALSAQAEPMRKGGARPIKRRPERAPGVAPPLAADPSQAQPCRQL